MLHNTCTVHMMTVLFEYYIIAIESLKLRLIYICVDKTGFLGAESYSIMDSSSN